MDILQELRQIARERDISVEELKVELEMALAAAYQKYVGEPGDVTVKLDPSKKSGAVILKEVVGEVLVPEYQISVQAARQKKEDSEIGDFVESEIDTVRFGRIAAQAFKQVLSQKLRDAERRRMHDTFRENKGEVMTGVVTRRFDRTVKVQINRVEVDLLRSEQMQTDDYRPNERMRFYILDEREMPPMPKQMEEEGREDDRVLVSRTHKNLLRKLLEMEVPELGEGIIEIMAIEREAGQRSKVAVLSHDERVDAVGACVGPRGSRIQAIMDELRPEKIDIVPWASDTKQMITNALSPAKVNEMHLFFEDEDRKRTAYVIVPDSHLSLAIGRGGQNVRLAAKLTGWKLDIRSEEHATRERQEFGSIKGAVEKRIADDEAKAAAAKREADEQQGAAVAVEGASE